MSYKDKEKNRAYQKLRWKNMSNEEKERRAKKSIERLKGIRKFISDYKLEHGCKDCGYKEYACALDFDHVTGDKVTEVPVMRSMKKIKEEIEKCEVVCANCHRIRTFNRYPDTYKS